MVNETILAIIIAFAISAALCPVVIPFLHRLKFGQQVRDDGPQSHLKKQGTPIDKTSHICSKERLWKYTFGMAHAAFILTSSLAMDILRLCLL